MMESVTTKSFIARINPQTLLFFVHNFFINVGTTLVYVSANILLLENHPESSLPLAYIAAAFAVMAAGKIYEYFEHHLLLERLSMGTMLSSLFMVLVVMLLLWLGHGIATAIAIMVGYRIIYLLINLEFWGLSALVFDVRQSKRLFSVIGSGDMPAKALGAVLAVLIHTPSVLMILLAISLVFFALAFYSQRLTFKYTEIPNPHHAKARQAQEANSVIVQKYFGGNKLVTALCLGMVFIAAAATWIEYHFFVNVKYKFHSQHDVIFFVGSLLTATYVISTIVKVLFSGKTVERFGVRLTLYLLPLTTILISLGLIVSSYFRKDEPSLLVYYCIAYLLFELVRRTIFDPVFLVLFQPLSTKNRLKGHTLAKGLYEPLGMLMAGVLLWIVYTQKWSNIGLTFDLSLFFAIGAMVILRIAYGQYVLELKSAISKRFLRSGEMASPGEALPIIIENLKSEKKEEVINAIDWLAKNKESSFKRNIEILLKNPNVAVRLKTLETLYLLKNVTLPASFPAYIEREPDSACQTLAVRLACSNALLSQEKIAYYLAHEDTDIVKGTIIGCWESNVALPLVHGTLQNLFRANSSQSQITALECVRITGVSGYDGFVKNALQAGAPKVQEQAIEIIAGSQSKEMVDQLKPFLSGHLSKQTVIALVKSANSGNELLENWIGTEADEQGLHTFSRALEQHPKRALLEILFKLIKSTYNTNLSIHSSQANQTSILVRHAALKALTHFSPDAEQLAHSNELVEKELVHASFLLSGMEEHAAGSQLYEALQYEFEYTTERLFYLFMVLYDKDSVLNAWKGMKHASKEKRANSLEMIESLLPRVLYPALRALFEDITVQEQRVALGQYLGNRQNDQPVISYILDQKEKYFTSWTIALAVNSAAPDSINDENIQLLLAHPVRLIREIAQQKFSGSKKLFKEQTMKHAEISQQISEMERVIVLKNTQLFAKTPENVLSSIAPIMKEITYNEGSQIFAKGDIGDSMYVIYTGEVGIYDGTKQLALFDKGEIFGELALMDTEPRSATTVAETDVLLFRIDQEDFFELMEERDEILRNVLRILCQRIRVQNEKMRILSTT
jgi:HEAT repeat protein